MEINIILPHKELPYTIGRQAKPSLNSLDKASSTMTNSSGLRTEPWCTPTLTVKAFLSLSQLPSLLLLLYHSHYPFILTQISQCPHNHLPRLPIKHFLKINKGHLQVFLLCQLFFLQLTNSEKNICHAPPCHKSELHFDNFHIFSHPTFSDSFQNIHSLFHQRYAPVLATSQCIPSTLVDIHQLVPYSMSSGILPSFTTALHTSAIHFISNLTSSLHHICHIARWSRFCLTSSYRLQHRLSTSVVITIFRLPG